MKRVIRWLSLAVLLCGILAMGDYAMNRWGPGEVVTGLQNHRAQRQLEAQLDNAYEDHRTVASTCKSIPTPSPCKVKIAGPPTPKVLPRLREGQAVGRLKADGINAIITYGRKQSSINKGPGLWHARPGQRRTVAISGHRTTYGAPFRHIDGLHKGDKLTLSTPWGTWRYRVEGIRVVRPNDIWVVRNRGYDRLVLTACHPPGSAAYRYIVFAKLV